MGLGRTIVVPFARPASAVPLVRLAAAIAAPDDGTVVPVKVVRPRASTTERAEAVAAITAAERAARATGVRATGIVIPAPTTTDGVLTLVVERGASLVLMGWKGESTTSNVFGELIDSVVGRSSVPVAVVRLGEQAPRRLLLPLSSDHLLPAGERGIALAADLAGRLHADGMPVQLLRTDAGTADLPRAVADLSDRVHHDPRRLDQAVGAAARPEDLVVAAVPPTVSGLRAATTHLAWASPTSSLLVAVDVGPSAAESGLADAVADANDRIVDVSDELDQLVRVVVTVRGRGEPTPSAADLSRALAPVGRVDRLVAWWEGPQQRVHLRARVTIEGTNPNAAVGAAMTALHDAEAFGSAEIRYDLDREERRSVLRLDSLTPLEAAD